MSGTRQKVQLETLDAVYLVSLLSLLILARFTLTAHYSAAIRPFRTKRYVVSSSASQQRQLVFINIIARILDLNSSAQETLNRQGMIDGQIG
jgi:hypothetical protein